MIDSSAVLARGFSFLGKASQLSGYFKQNQPWKEISSSSKGLFYSSADPSDECYLYKLANFRKSGQLVEAFNNEGSKVNLIIHDLQKIDNLRITSSQLH